MSDDEKREDTPEEKDTAPACEVVPGLDPALQVQRESEFEAAVKALDSRGQRVVGQLLAGARTTEVAERLSAGDVEVLSGGIVTSTKRTDGSAGSSGTGGAMRAALRLAGIDETYLANVLREGLKARKVLVIAGKRKHAPDHAVRIRYLELAHRLRGDLAKDDAAAGTETYEERIKMVMRRALPTKG